MIKIKPNRFVTLEFREENRITARHILLAGLDIGAWKGGYDIHDSLPIRDEEELDIALEHYKFLRENSCLSFIGGNKSAKTL